MPLELPDGWRDQLPEDIKSNGVLDTISTIDQMATMIVNSRTDLAQSIRIPTDDASPEKKTEFLDTLKNKVPDLVYVGEGADLSNLYDRMGRPKEASEYGLKDIPEPLVGNFENLSKKAHELGLSAGQLNGLTETILGDFNTSKDTQASKVDEIKGAVKKEYGEATDDHLTAASDFAKQLGFDDNLVSAIKDGAIGLDNMKAFDKVMGGFESPGPRIGGEPGTSRTTLTPWEAEQQLTEMQNNKEHPYNNPGSHLHDEAKKKFVELVTAADAGKKPTETEKFRAALNS